MATTRVRGGYDYQFVEEPPHELKCVICLAVARQPQQHGECGKLFCSSCLAQHRQKNNKCPNCDLQLNTFYDGKSEYMYRVIVIITSIIGDVEVKALQVKCSNVVNGCPWVGDLGFMLRHSTACNYQAVRCPNNCTTLESDAKLLQKDLNEHLAICPNRSHQCPHCSILGPYEKIITLHIDSCPKAKVQCPYPECNQSIQRCYLDTHINYCPHKAIQCKFADVGCPAILKLADLQEHEENDLLHLQLTKENVLELTKILKERETRFRVFIEQRNKVLADLHYSMLTCVRYKGPATLKFREFDMHKLQDKFFASSKFYLKTGYRFQLGIYANGRNQGANTHVSVYLAIREGQDDEYLTWPFQGSVKVELLNQLQDRNHFSDNIRFPNIDYVSGKMVEGKTTTGWGKEQFVSNRELANISSKRQYLRSDTLYFRITSVEKPVKKGSA